MEPITPTYQNTGGYGIADDVFYAINAKFREPVQRQYGNLGLHLNDNVTVYDYQDNITYNDQPVSIEIDGIDYEVGIPTNFSNLLVLLNAMDIGWFYQDSDGNLVVRGFHAWGDITQDSEIVFLVDDTTELTHRSVQTDINRELAFRINNLNSTIAESVAIPFSQIVFGNLASDGITSSVDFLYHPVNRILSLSNTFGDYSLYVDDYNHANILQTFGNSGGSATSIGNRVMQSTSSLINDQLFETNWANGVGDAGYFSHIALRSLTIGSDLLYDSANGSQQNGIYLGVNGDRLHIKNDWVGLYARQRSGSSITTTLPLRFYEAASNGGNTPNYVALRAPASLSVDTTWTLPTTDSTGTQALVSNGSGTLSWASFGTGSGTVTAVLVATANGFAGSSSGGATPALTLSTTISGLLKGNGTAISAASAADVTGSVLTGYTSGAGTVSSSDSILQAIQKLNGNIDAITLSSLGGANTALSNLTSLSINTSLLAQTGVDLGSTSAPFRDIYIFGSGTYSSTYIKLTGTPTSSRTLTLPNVTDTLVGKATTDTFTNKTITDFNLTVVTSSAGTLTIDNTGSLFVFSGSTATWTLPALSGNTNRCFFIKNRGTGVLTLNAAGADSMWDIAAITTIAINPGEGWMIFDDGTYWNLM